MFSSNKFDKIIVSVIIPVFNDTEGLLECLACLAQQTLPKRCYEVIVVDNNEKPKISSLPYSAVKVIHEATPGAYAARNAGLRIASGDIVAFTDADCRPAKDWLSVALAHILPTDGKVILAGEVEIFPENESNPNIYECYDIAIGIRQQRFVTLGGFSATANLVAFLAVFEKVGYFNENLKSSGDYEWGARARQAGFKFLYCADLVVLHPARSTFLEIFKKARRTTGGIHDLAVEGSVLGSKQLNGIPATPLETLRDLIQSGKLPYCRQKIAVLFVAAGVTSVRLSEKLLLRMGLRSKRA